MNERQAFLRILDANYNRAKEALRVSEDVARFLMKDPVLSSGFKRARHALTQTLLKLPVSYSKLLESRDSLRDVGRNSGIRDRKKAGWKDVMAANLKRAQEALRVLEEISKILAPRSTRFFEKIRFDLYDLEKRTVRKF